jgi:glutathione S-transferase
MIRLLGIRYSPWTQRARWALDHCGLRYQFYDYLPGVGEPMLRLRMRTWRGIVQVPVLFADGAVVADSGAIARYAAGVVGGAPLGDLEAAQRWEALSDAACSEGRLRLLGRSLADPRVLEESLEGSIPRVLQASFRWLSRAVMRVLAAKYGALAREGAMRQALLAARAELTTKPYLLGTFSYADIALASCLQMIEPLTLKGPAMRTAWTWPELASEFADLLRWRQRLLAETNPRLAAHLPLAA